MRPFHPERAWPGRRCTSPRAMRSWWTGCWRSRSALDGPLMVSAAPVGPPRHRNHGLVAPGEVSSDDATTTGHAPLPPTGAHAPGRQSSESSSGWGRSPSSSSPAPPRPGPTKLGTEIAEVLTLGAAHGPEPLLAALERAVTFGRWRADDVRPVHGRRRPCTPSDIGWSGAGVDVAVGADQVLGRLPDRHRCRGR